MHWFQGPQHGLDHHKLGREKRHEPFTPNVPGFFLARPVVTGLVLVVVGIFGNWMISTRLSDWPSWMLFPSMMLAVVALIMMIIGLGLLTVRMLEPVLGLMDLDWDAEPLAQLGIPLALQRKCESLGYWTAEDLVRAVDRGRFPWTSLEYDERMQVQRGVDRWSLSVANERRTRRGRRLLRRQSSSRNVPGGQEQ